MIHTTRLRATAAVALASLALAACGGDDAADPAEPTAATATDAPAVDDPATDAEPTEGEATEGEASEPEAQDGDCSAAGLVGEADFGGLGGEVATTASFLLDAAVRCDQQVLVATASEDGTRLTFGNLTPEEFFALPEASDDEPAHYELVARLLASTTGVPSDEGDFVVWPAVFSDPSSDANWDELVTSGLYDEDRVREMREFADDGNGYFGWRIGIGGDGQFQFLVSGD